MQVCIKDAYKIHLNGQAGRQKKEEDTLRIAVLTPSFAFYDYLTLSSSLIHIIAISELLRSENVAKSLREVQQGKKHTTVCSSRKM